MTDPSSEFENLLKRFKPVPPSKELANRIAGEIEAGAATVAQRRRTSDWCLLATMTAGLAAACVIVTFLALDYSVSKTPAPAGQLSVAPPETPHRLLAQLMQDERSFHLDSTDK